MKRFFALLLLPVALCSWSPLVEFDALGGGFRTGGSAIGFVPVYQDPWGLIFLQGEVGRYQCAWNYNLGIGMRHSCSPWWGYGVALFGDIAQSKNNRTYYGGGISAELFGPCWVARANGYIPTDRNKVIEEFSTPQFGLNGTQFQLSESYLRRVERPYFGGDAEIGRGWCRWGGELWAFAGFYIYDAPHVKPLVGPKLRAEYRICPAKRFRGVQAHVGGEWLYDRHHRSDFSVIVRVQVPFCCRPCPSMSRCDRMGEPVRRQRGMWIITREERGTREIPLNQGLFFVQGMSPAGAVEEASGTQEHPASIEQVRTLATQENDIIILLNDAREPIELSETYSLLPGQVLAGFLDNDSITFKIAGHEYVVENKSHSGPALLSGGDFPLVELQGDNTLFGFHSTGGTETLQSTSVGFCDVHDLTLDGAHLLGAKGAKIENVTCTKPLCVGGEKLLLKGAILTGGGLELDGISNAVVENLTIHGAEIGVQVKGGRGVQLKNIRVLDPATAGLVLEDTVGVRTSGFSVHGGDVGVSASGGSDISLTDVQVISPTNAAFALEGVQGGSFDNCLLSGGGVGMELKDNSGTFAIRGTTVSGNSTGAIALDGGSATYNFTDCAVISAAGTLLTVDGGSNSVSTTNSSFVALGTEHGVMATATTGGHISLDGLGVEGASASVITLASCAGDFTFTSAKLSSGPSATGLAFNHQKGNVTMEGTLLQPPAMAAIDIRSNEGTCDLSGLSVTQKNATGTALMLLGNEGEIALGTLTLSTSSSNYLTLLDANRAAISIENPHFSVTSVDGFAFNVSGQTGPLTLGAKGDIFAQFAGAVSIQGGGADMTIDSMIGGAGVSGALRVEKVTSGDLKFSRVVVAGSNNAPPALFTDCTADVAIAVASEDGVGAPALIGFVNHEGSVDVGPVHMEAEDSVVRLEGGKPVVTMTGVVATGGTPNAAVVSGAVASLDVNTCEFAGDLVVVFEGAQGTLDLTVADNAAKGYQVISENPGALTATISGNKGIGMLVDNRGSGTFDVKGTGETAQEVLQAANPDVVPPFTVEGTVGVAP